LFISLSLTGAKVVKIFRLTKLLWLNDVNNRIIKKIVNEIYPLTIYVVNNKANA